MPAGGSAARSTTEYRKHSAHYRPFHETPFYPCQRLPPEMLIHKASNIPYNIRNPTALNTKI